MQYNKIVCIPNEAYHASDGSVKPRADIGYYLKKLDWETQVVKMYSQVTLDESAKKHIQDLAVSLYDPSKLNGLLYQYPSYCGRDYETYFIQMFKKIGFQVIGFEHDIDYLRGFLLDYQEDIKVLNNFDLLLVSSIALQNELKTLGVIIPTSLYYPFSYHSETIKAIEPKDNKDKLKVNYAGNLSKSKAGFLLDLLSDCDLNIYGNNIDDLDFHGHYLGSLSAENLQFKSGWGLVWDSESNSTYKPHDYNTYLTYNFSYKLSGYLRNGLPIIAKQGSNVGHWVQKHKCGILVSDLSDLGSLLETIPYEDFYAYCQQAYNMSELIEEGYYMKCLNQDIEGYLERFKGV